MSSQKPLEEPALSEALQILEALEARSGDEMQFLRWAMIHVILLMTLLVLIVVMSSSSVLNLLVGILGLIGCQHLGQLFQQCHDQYTADCESLKAMARARGVDI